MKKLFYLLMFALAFAGCKKERAPEAICVSENVILKMNTYNPDESQIGPLLRTFIKENQACKASRGNLKTLVVTEDRAVDQALFQMEAVLNYERGHILDPTLQYEKTETMGFTVATKGYDADGKVLLDGNDMMSKYVTVEGFALNNANGKEMISMDFALEKIEAGLAYFEVSKSTGEEKQLTVGTDHFTAAQGLVMAVLPFTCGGTSSLPGYELINQRIFDNNNIVPITCSNGGSIVYYNLGWARIYHNDPNDPDLYDPIAGSWYNYNDYIYYKFGSGAYPNHCMDYNELNKYLDGARYIYNHQLAIDRYFFGTNFLITKFVLEGAMYCSTLPNPDEYTVEHGIYLECANYSCIMPY